MSKQSHNNTSHYNNHEPAAAEIQQEAAHAHEVAEEHHHGHLSGAEQSRRANEHSEKVHERQSATVGHGISSFGHHEIAELAYKLWLERGGKEGSAEQDWNQAAEQLRTRSTRM